MYAEAANSYFGMLIVKLLGLSGGAAAGGACCAVLSWVMPRVAVVGTTGPTLDGHQKRCGRSTQDHAEGVDLRP